jgi:hypothetical protein
VYSPGGLEYRDNTVGNTGDSMGSIGVITTNLYTGTWYS